MRRPALAHPHAKGNSNAHRSRYSIANPLAAAAHGFSHANALAIPDPVADAIPNPIADAIPNPIADAIAVAVPFADSVAGPNPEPDR